MTRAKSLASPLRSGPRGLPGVPRATALARVLKNDQEALSVAKELAADFARGAAQRNANRLWPLEELKAFSQSGLWSINIPKQFGGPEVSYVTLTRVIELISTAEPSLGQIPQNHLSLVAAIRTVSSPAQQALLFAEVLRGIHFGNAFSEFGSTHAANFDTRFTDHGDHVLVTGRKFYSTGAALAHRVPIVALDNEGKAWYAIADRDAAGLTVIDDWSSFGQRTPLSGSVILDNVKVPKTHLVPAYRAYERPTADGAVFQIIQAAANTGIGAAAIEDTLQFVRQYLPNRGDNAQQRALEDSYTLQAVGSLTLRLSATRALLEKAAVAVDLAVAGPTQENVTAAQIAVAESKIFSTELAAEASAKLFELTGTRSARSEHSLDPHWRNASGAPLHEPLRWKYALLGNYHLNGIAPPLHAWS